MTDEYEDDVQEGVNRGLVAMFWVLVIVGAFAVWSCYGTLERLCLSNGGGASHCAAVEKARARGGG